MAGKGKGVGWWGGGGGWEEGGGTLFGIATLAGKLSSFPTILFIILKISVVFFLQSEHIS